MSLIAADSFLTGSRGTSDALYPNDDETPACCRLSEASLGSGGDSGVLKLGRFESSAVFKFSSIDVLRILEASE